MKLHRHPSPLRCNKNERFTGHLLCARLCSKYFVHSYSLNPNNNTLKQILSSLPYRKESTDTGGSCPNHKAVMMTLRCWLGDQAPLPHLITPAAQGPPRPGICPGCRKGWRTCSDPSPALLQLSESPLVIPTRSFFPPGRKTSSAIIMYSFRNYCLGNKCRASGIQAVQNFKSLLSQSYCLCHELQKSVSKPKAETGSFLSPHFSPLLRR